MIDYMQYGSLLEIDQSDGVSAAKQKDYRKGDHDEMMKEYKLAKLEARFADLIWEREPIASPELVKLCEREFDWKKSTTYTVLKKLCDRGIFRNENATVTSLMTREEFYGHKGREFVEDSFGGSIPRFLAAFMGGRKLTPKQAAEIKEMIDSFTEEEQP